MGNCPRKVNKYCSGAKDIDFDQVPKKYQSDRVIINEKLQVISFDPNQPKKYLPNRTFVIVIGKCSIEPFPYFKISDENSEKVLKDFKIFKTDFLKNENKISVLHSIKEENKKNVKEEEEIEEEKKEEEKLENKSTIWKKVSGNTDDQIIDYRGKLCEKSKNLGNLFENSNNFFEKSKKVDNFFENYKTNIVKSNNNLEKSNNNLENSNSNSNKNIENSNKNLENSNKNLENSNKNYEILNKNYNKYFEKSNKNLAKKDLSLPDSKEINLENVEHESKTFLFSNTFSSSANSRLSKNISNSKKIQSEILSSNASFYRDTLGKYYSNKFTFEDLKRSIINQTGEENFEKYLTITVRSEKFKYFLNQNLTREGADSCAFILRIYTGCSFFIDVNNGTCAICRIENNEKFAFPIEEFIPVLYFMNLALSTIPYYWGKTIRKINLMEDELNNYKPGNIISFLQFSSSSKITSKREKTPNYFKNRDTFLIIYSLTGRYIKNFSEYPEEKEVIYPPFSTFLVLKAKKKNNKNYIYLRQIELGISNKTIMWVDDNIYNKHWENKELMEKTTKNLEENIHFIPKTCTELALDYLKSPFAKKLKNSENFRIVTDLYRKNESNPEEAGAVLINEIRNLGFVNNKILVFTGKGFEKERNSRYFEDNRKKAESVLKKNCELDNAIVECNPENVLKFLNFNEKINDNI